MPDDTIANRVATAAIGAVITGGDNLAIFEAVKAALPAPAAEVIAAVDVVAAPEPPAETLDDYITTLATMPIDLLAEQFAEQHRGKMASRGVVTLARHQRISTVIEAIGVARFPDKWQAAADAAITA